MDIVGGTYREICASPDWDQLFGSGLRAAAICDSLANDSGGVVTLHTLISMEDSTELAARAKAFHCKLEITPRPDQITFMYEHPLSAISLWPSRDRIKRVPLPLIETKNILMFGMVEGSAAVRGERVVFDPQGSDISFVHSGSSADTLAIVANLDEARRMLADSTAAMPTEAAAIASLVLEKEHAQVVVVKAGPEGAVIATKVGTTSVPCYKTSSVFKIGSGDVFTAIFAWYWAYLRLAPDVAAKKASAGTALYCSMLSCPTDTQIENLKLVPVASSSRTKTVYLAGPLFNMPQRWFVREAARCLQQFGLRVFSPLDDVGTSLDAVKIASCDLQGLDDADIVFAVVDGVDSGTLFELGYAVARRKPVICYGEYVDETQLTMVLGSGAILYGDFCSAVYNTAWMAMSL